MRTVVNIPIFGVSGCGKTRAVIELLSQHWGFYFNAAGDDWGSDDVSTLHDTVETYLPDTQEFLPVDREANNRFARKTTLLLFLSRLLIFRYCLRIPGSSKAFTSAKWTLLQVCPHVLFGQDIFNTLFSQVVELCRHHGEIELSDFVSELLDKTRDFMVKHGCLPNIKGNTRFLVVHDEAQILGDAFNTFKSTSSSDNSPRPLLSPILAAFRDIGQNQLSHHVRHWPLYQYHLLDPGL